MKKLLFLLVMFSLIFPGEAFSQIATVSHYKEGYRTANGEIYKKNGFTAAHRSLPFGTLVRFHYKGRSVVVRINDRGPFVRGRTFDLSLGAARALGCLGICNMEYEILKNH